MASNYTENYGLCQWEATDQVLREEFNQDNSKVDEALFQLQKAVKQKADQSELEKVESLMNRGRFTKLQEIKIPENTGIVEIDLSRVDWNKWSSVHLDCVTNNIDQAYLYYNTTAQENQRFCLDGIQGMTHRPRLTFRVGFDSQRLIDAVWGTETYLDKQSYSELHKLIVCGDTMYSEAAFVLWGEI